jgi:hypothetical protein
MLTYKHSRGVAKEIIRGMPPTRTHLTIDLIVRA